MEYFERLELSQSLETRERKNKRKHTPEHHNYHHEKKKNKRKEKTCSVCKKKGHTKEECWWNPDNSDNKLKKKKKFKKGYKKYSNEEIAAMIAQLPSFSKNKPQKKKNESKEKGNSDSDDDFSSDEETGFLIRKTAEINVSSSSDEDYTDSTKLEQCYVNERPNKRLKPTPQSTEIVGEIKNREGDVRPIRVLLDTGTSATIVLKRYVMRGSQRVSRNQKTKWTTMGGSLICNHATTSTRIPIS